MEFALVKLKKDLTEIIPPISTLVFKEGSLEMANETETYLLTLSLHLLNETEQMISVILDGQSLDKNMLEMHRHNIQETINKIKTKLEGV